jgi:RND family efflux transporter MFP subunit
VQANAYEGEPVGGRVTFVGRAIDTQSRTLPIEVSFDNSGMALRPEMVVRLEVSRAVLDDVIALPLGAIVRDERGTGVLVVAPDSAQGNALVARYRAVELGPSSGGRTVITSGLEPGDQVVASGRAAINEGERVRVSDTAPVAALLRR